MTAPRAQAAENDRGDTRPEERASLWDGARRHWSVLRESWAAEGERRRRAKRFEEVDFLPAALEIMEKPPAPAGRAVLWAVLIFFLAALIWAIFGKVDVVATATGKLIPRDRVKLIQPAEIGVVRAIHVSDGMQVEAGDPLIELDPTISGADEAAARRALRMARVSKAQGQALLSYIDGLAPVFDPPEGADETLIRMQRRLIASRIAEYEARLAALERRRAEREADLQVVESEIAKLLEMQPLLEEQLAAREELTAKGLSPRLLLLELKERHVSHIKDIQIQRQQRAKMLAALETIDRQIDQLDQEFRREVLSELNDAEDQAMIQLEELRKATKRNMLQQLKAPIDGIVQQLAVHTIGGVVQPAEPVMIIVPGKGDLVVEAMVQNKDIGFVRKGDPVEVKLEAFPFTKYGVIDGTLEDLSTDAIQNEDLGLVYAARIVLDRTQLTVGDKTVTLSPGMAATAEIKTGQRRLIEYLLSPLLRYRDEAMRER